MAEGTGAAAAAARGLLKLFKFATPVEPIMSMIMNIMMKEFPRRWKQRGTGGGGCPPTGQAARSSCAASTPHASRSCPAMGAAEMLLRRRRRRRRRLHTRRRRAGQKRLPRRQRARPACCLRMARFSCLHDRRRRRRLRRLQVCRRCCSQLQTTPPVSRLRGRRGARSRDPGGRPARRCGGRLAMSCVITNTGLINGRGVECHLLNTNQEIVDTKSYMETRRKEASKFGKIF